MLAEAGLKRIGRTMKLPRSFLYRIWFLRLLRERSGIQCRSGDERILGLVAPLHDVETGAATEMEREFLATLQAGCNTPIGCIGNVVDGVVHAFARALSRDGSRSLEYSMSDTIVNAKSLGHRPRRRDD